MEWVAEREDWLLDWSESRCVGELQLGGAPSTPPSSVAEDEQSVIFSDVIEVGGLCLIARARGLLVEVFDLSPQAQSLTSWRLSLPAAVVPGGIACARAAAGDAVWLFFLTEANVVHCAQVRLRGLVLEAVAQSSVALSLASAPSAFLALDVDILAVGCANGLLQVSRLRETSSAASFELSDAKLWRRLYGGLGYAKSPPVLALCGAGASGGGLGGRHGHDLFSFSADGQLRLWRAEERSGYVLASIEILGSESLVGTASAYMRMSRCMSRACLVLRSAIYVVDIALGGLGQAATLTAREVRAPFAGAVPSLASLMHDNLWVFWSDHMREQLFRVDLQVPNSMALQLGAIDACNLSEVGSESAAGRVAIEGCAPSRAPADAEGGSYPSNGRAVFTLQQQHDVWRSEEDGFDALHLIETLESEPRYPSASLDDQSRAAQGVEESTLKWWVGRIFLPGRFSSGIIAAALGEAGAHPAMDAETIVLIGASASGNRTGSGGLQSLVEAHIRRRAVGDRDVSLAGQAPYASSSPLQSAMLSAAAANDFVCICEGVWRRRHQVSSICASHTWASHLRLPAGSPAIDAMPLVIRRGGVSCVRLVHTWSERWWATLHMTRDLSNYEKFEIDDVLRMSLLDEWKVCTIAWFLSQCVGVANVNSALAVMGRGSPPSAKFRRFMRDVPNHLIAHLDRCVQLLASRSLCSHLQSIQKLIQAAISADERCARIDDSVLDTLRGAWSRQAPALDEGARQGRVTALEAQGSTRLLSDKLRGGIVLGESESACAAMRDLLLLSVYVSSTGADRVTLAAWEPLTQVLDDQLPRGLALRQSMMQSCCDPSVVDPGIDFRAAHLWASMFRGHVEGGARSVGVRVPLRSFVSVQYAMLLIHHECWEAVRLWSGQQSMRELVAYIAAREWLARRRYDEAREAFVQGEGSAHVVEACEETSGHQAASSESPVISYNARVACLFGGRGRLREEYYFMHRAALASEAFADTEGSLHQHLWSSAFELAVQLESWEDACDALVRIQAFQSPLRLLGQKLRSTGNLALVIRLPEKHRSYFLTSLHESASMSAPTVGSDSLTCFNLLYALHFSGQEYLKAAVVAHMLYSALGESMKSALPSGVGSPKIATMDRSMLEAGDSVSSMSDIPPPHCANDVMKREEPHGFTAYAQSLEHVWPVLEQQRNALLMLVSALSLTPEQLMVVPHAHASLGAHDVTMAGGPDHTPNLAQLRSWFTEAAPASRSVTVTLGDAEKLLAVVEAQMVMAGRSDLSLPGDLAQCVAALGLVGLALRICTTHGLDLWQFALRPFTRLCVAAEGESDEKIAALADAARGPSQLYMFGRSDGCAPLGCEGSSRAGLWQTLRQSLAQVAGPDAPCASAVRLYTLVADEVLTLGKPLPSFILNALADGPAWVRLLRVYMKHSLASEALELLRRHHRRCGPPSVAVAAKERPMQDFPASLVLQLRAWLSQQADGRLRENQYSSCLASVEELLTEYRVVLEEEKSVRAA